MITQLNFKLNSIWQRNTPYTKTATRTHFQTTKVKVPNQKGKKGQEFSQKIVNSYLRLQ